MNRHRDAHGVMGKATSITINDEVFPAPTPGLVAAWLLDCSGYHDTWKFHSLEAVSIADAPIEPSAPGNTHQIVLAALDTAMIPRPSRPSSWARLAPLNLIYQITAPDDQTVADVLAACVTDVVNGNLPPEHPDLRDLWTETIDKHITETTATH